MSARTPSAASRLQSRTRDESIAPNSAQVPRVGARRVQSTTLRAPLSAAKATNGQVHTRRFATLGAGTAAEVSAMMKAQNKPSDAPEGGMSSQPAALARQAAVRKQSIDVTVRIRPLGAATSSAFLSGKAALRREGDNACQSIAIMDATGAGSEALRQTAVAPGTTVKQVMSFDRVMDESASQHEVFNRVAAPMVDAFMDGTNCALLAYGQTGSGKTHTMIGDLDETSGHGILPRSLHRIFAKKTEMETAGGWKINLAVSCMEIYKDDAFDLMPKAQAAAPRVVTAPAFAAASSEAAAAAALAGSKVRVRIIGEGTQIDNLHVESVSSADDGLAALHKALARRVTGSTAANLQSSRSHAVISVYLDASRSVAGSSADTPMVVRRKAIFDIVDLAGSERQAHTAAESDRLKEAAQINGSLLVLKQIIKGMKDAQVLRSASRTDTMLRWRDSTLTSVLRRSLLGNCSTSIIATINPDVAFWPETLATLDFAVCASKVRTEVSLVDAVTVDDDAMARRQAALEEEVRVLRSQLAAATQAASGLAGKSGSDAAPTLEPRLVRQMTFEAEADVRHCSVEQPEVSSSPAVRSLRAQLSAAAAAAQRWLGQLRLPPAPPSPSHDPVDDRAANSVQSEMAKMLHDARQTQWHLMMAMSRQSMGSMEDALNLVDGDFPADTLERSPAAAIPGRQGPGSRESAGTKRRRADTAVDDARMVKSPAMAPLLAEADVAKPAAGAQRSFRVLRRESALQYDDDFADTLFHVVDEPDQGGVDDHSDPSLQHVASAAGTDGPQSQSHAMIASLQAEHLRTLQQLRMAEERALTLEAELRKTMMEGRMQHERSKDVISTASMAVGKVSADMSRIDLPEVLLRSSSLLDQLWKAYKAERQSQGSRSFDMQARIRELERELAAKDAALEQAQQQVVVLRAARAVDEMEHVLCPTTMTHSGAYDQMSEGSDAAVGAQADPTDMPSEMPAEHVEYTTAASIPNSSDTNTGEGCSEPLLSAKHAALPSEADAKPPVAPRQRRLVPLREIIKPVRADEKPRASGSSGIAVSSTPYWTASPATGPQPRTSSMASLEAAASSATEPGDCETRRVDAVHDDAVCIDSNDENNDDDVVSFHPRRQPPALVQSAVKSFDAVAGSSSLNVLHVAAASAMDGSAQSPARAAPPAAMVLSASRMTEDTTSQEVPPTASKSRPANSRNFLKSLIQRAQ